MLDALGQQSSYIHELFGGGLSKYEKHGKQGQYQLWQLL
jgi:hypothetical protein